MEDSSSGLTRTSLLTELAHRLSCWTASLMSALPVQMSASTDPVGSAMPSPKTGTPSPQPSSGSKPMALFPPPNFLPVRRCDECKMEGEIDLWWIGDQRLCEFCS